MYSELEIAATDFTSYTKKRKETMRKVTAERLEKHVGSLARPGQCSKSLRSEFAPGACIERRHSCTWDTFTCPIAVWTCSAVRRRFEVWQVDIAVQSQSDLIYHSVDGSCRRPLRNSGTFVYPPAYPAVRPCHLS